MKWNEDEIQSLKKYAQLAGEDDEEMMEIIQTIAMSRNEKAFLRLKEYLMLQATHQIVEQDPFFPHPKENTFYGNLEIGVTKNGISWKIDPNELCKNLLCSGIVGAGKTTMAFGLMEKLHNLGIKILSLGVKKDVRHIACDRVPMLVLRFARNGNFSLGDIFQPPEGVDEIDYQTAVIKCLAITTFIGESGKALLLDVITDLRAKQGYVDLSSVIQHLKQMRGISRRQTDWLATLVNRLTGFYIIFGPMLMNKDCFPFEKVVERYNIELELDGAGEFQPFFSALVELRLFKYRIANNIRGNKLLTAVFCDEVNVLASKAMERHAFQLGSAPTMLEYLPLCREFGFGNIMYSNQPSEVSNVLKAQAGVKVAMRLGSWSDILDMGNSMILNQDQMKSIVDLPPGHAVVKMQGISPFLGNIPSFEVAKTVTDERIAMHNRKLLKDTEFEKFLIDPGKVKGIVIPDVNVNKDEEMKRNFMFDVVNRWNVGLTDRYRSLGLNIEHGNRLFHALRNDNLLMVHKINLCGRGSPTTFLEVTQKGFSMLNIEPKKGYSVGGSFLHKVVQHHIRETFKKITEIKGFYAEKQLGNKVIDVLVELHDGKKIAIEIAISSVNELVNIKKDLEAGCDYVITVCKDKKIFKEVEDLVANLPDEHKASVLICIVYQILKCKTLADIFVLKK